MMFNFMQIILLMFTITRALASNFKENHSDKNQKPTLTYYYPKSGVQTSDSVMSSGVIDQFRTFTSFSDSNFKNVLGHAVAVGKRNNEFLILEQTHFLPGGSIMTKVRLINLPNQGIQFDQNGFYTPGKYTFPIVDGTGIYLGASGYIEFNIDANTSIRTVNVHVSRSSSNGNLV